jgi:hypothetical protein
MKTDCPICKGIGWVCENCPDQPWSDEIGCTCGAGMLCRCRRNNKDLRDGIEEPDVSQVIERPSPRR